MTPTPSGLLRPMLPYLRQVAGLLVIGSLAGIAMNTAVVLPAIALGHAIDVALAVAGNAATPTDLTRAAMLVVAAALATELPRVGKRWWLGVARSRIRASVRFDALRGVLAWPAERLRRTPIGEVMARIIGDVEVLGTGLGEIIVETWDTLLFSASLIVVMCWVDLPLAAVALLPAPVALLLAKASGRWITARTLEARQANAAVTGYLSEHLTGLRIVRAFGRTRATTDALGALARRQADAALAATRLTTLLQPTYAILMTSGIVAVVWWGGQRVGTGALTVGGLVAFLSLFVRFTARAHRIPQMANRVQAARAAYTRLSPLLATTSPPSSPEPPAPRGPASVRLTRVDFAYPGTDTLALQGVTLTMPPGRLIAVTGAVGSGKTALACAVAGLVPIAGGELTVDGRNPHEWTPAQRATLGYLPQGHPVFSGTVRENVTLGASHPDRFCTAATVAGLREDLEAWPDGADTQIGELGVRVSGGQRQRIALARALAAPAVSPGLLVLDDPFSAVDIATEAAIIKSLREQQATILLCSTRLAAFPLADHVVVLDAGRVAEQGRHDDLIAAGGLYARIHLAQQRIQQAQA